MTTKIIKHDLVLSVERDGCCALCNPPSIADLETDCVKAQLGTRKTYICFACIADLGAVARTRRKRKRKVSPELVELGRDMIKAGYG